MSKLGKYRLRYEELKRTKASIGKMSDKKNEKRKELGKTNKEKNKMKTSNIETVKTIIITALVTGIITFIAGMAYAGSVHERVKAEAAGLVKVVQAEVREQQSK